MKDSNAFEDFGINISFNIDTIEIDNIFQKIAKNSNTDANSIIQITKSYSKIRSDIQRGEEILRIFHINYNSINIPQEFFENLMDLSYDNLRDLSNDIYKDMAKIHISSESIGYFSNLFVRYKYIKKAFLNEQ